MVKTLGNLQDEERFLYAANLRVPDNPVSASYAIREEATRALHTMIEAKLEEDHPARKIQAARIKALTGQIRHDVDHLIGQLESRVKLLEKQTADFDPTVANEQDAAVEKAPTPRQFLETKQEYESAREILQTMMISSASKRSALKIPRTPVTIHELPAKAASPVAK
jgi:uncharacterized protein involved in exopolysaccharide biosynthesis